MSDNNNNKRLSHNTAKNTKKTPQQNEFGRAMAHFFQVSVSIIACLAVGVFLGWLLDRWLGTTPWLMFVCTFLGVCAAFKSIFDFAKKIR